MNEFLPELNEEPTMNMIRPAASLRRLKGGCIGCVVLILLLFALLVCFLALALSQIFPRLVSAAGPMKTRVILIAAAVPPAQNDSQARGQFLQREIEVEYESGEVFLSSSSDTLAALMTDDVAELNVVHEDGTRARWSNDFRNAARTKINALPAQEVTKLFRRGTNLVTLTLYDLTPFTYWSAPYYLILEEDATPTRFYTPTRFATPTREVRLTPIVGLPVTTEPTQRPSPLATEVPIHTATPISSPRVQGNIPPQSISDSAWILFVAFGAVGIAALVLLFLFVRSRHEPMPTLTLTGWLDLFDTVTRESEAAIDLSKYPNGLALFVEPLRLTNRDGNENFFAAVVPTDKGAAVWSATADKASAPQILDDGMRVMVGKRLELEYRNPFARKEYFD